MGREDCEYSRKLLSLLSSAEVVSYLSRTRGERLPEQVLSWSGDYIFAFRSLAIVPMDTVKSASLAAVNFHPGPPEYPGSGCTNYALYEGAETFGVTAHLMEKVVDSGRILSSRRFPVAVEDNLDTLTEKTHSELFSLARKIMSDALLDPGWIHRALVERDPNITWSGTRKLISSIDELTEIPSSITRSELERRVRAFHHPDFPLALTLHGRRFLLTSDCSSSPD